MRAMRYLERAMRYLERAMRRIVPTTKEVAVAATLREEKMLINCARFVRERDYSIFMGDVESLYKKLQGFSAELGFRTLVKLNIVVAINDGDVRGSNTALPCHLYRGKSYTV